MNNFDKDGKLLVPDKELLKHGIIKRENKIHINHAFCPKGHELIVANNEIIDEFPSIKLWLKGDAGNEIIFISPVLNNLRRTGGDIFGKGDKLQICCPECGIQMPVLGPCECQWNGEYVMLSLDKDPENQNAVCFCDVWGCPKGDVRLADEVISEYMRGYQM
ncbi:MAG: hypothetical protein U9R19_12590 [Bacteroidota bacterium]|nr:hypothetical protein [Bacteroidota bacterium]